MRPKDKVQETIKRKLDFTASAGLHDRMLDDVLKAQEKSKQTKSAFASPNIRRQIMKNPIVRLAAAAVIAVAVLIAMNEFGSSNGGVAWGEVVRKVAGSPGVICREKQIQKDRKRGTVEFNWKVYASVEYGVRMDDYFDPEHSIQAYGTLKEGANILINHSSKTYRREPLTSDQRTELEELDSILKFRDILSLGYRELGRKIIDGVEAEGVETTNPEGAKISSGRPIEIDSHVAQLWVSVETNLPIFFESKTVCNNGTREFHIVVDEFQWDIELDASVFEPDIPEDYTQIGTSDSHKGTDARLKKWRFKDRHPERGYRLLSEDGQSAATIPESWADSPEHAVRVKEELDLREQQDNRELVQVREIEANGQLDQRILTYEYNLSDGQTVKVHDFDPDDPSQWTVIGKRQKELSQLLREQRRQEEKGQELATTEERQVHGRVFAFKKRRFVLSDGTEVVHSIGRLKDD